MILPAWLPRAADLGHGAGTVGKWQAQPSLALAGARGSFIPTAAGMAEASAEPRSLSMTPREVGSVMRCHPGPRPAPASDNAASGAASLSLVVGLGGLEPPASSFSAIEGSALCAPAFPQVAAEVRSQAEGDGWCCSQQPKQPGRPSTPPAVVPTRAGALPTPAPSWLDPSFRPCHPTPSAPRVSG